MISADVGLHRFNLRAAAVIVEDGQVLLHRLEGDTIWALPGGRVEAGEAASATVVREMLEETDEPLDCGPLRFVVENFFEHAGRPQHEVGLYFEAALRPASRLHDKTASHRGTEGGDVLEFRWFRLDALEGVELHPAFLRKALGVQDGGLRHAVQAGAQVA